MSDLVTRVKNDFAIYCYNTWAELSLDLQTKSQILILYTFYELAQVFYDEELLRVTKCKVRSQASSSIEFENSKVSFKANLELGEESGCFLLTLCKISGDSETLHVKLPLFESSLTLDDTIIQVKDILDKELRGIFLPINAQITTKASTISYSGSSQYMQPLPNSPPYFGESPLAAPHIRYDPINPFEGNRQPRSTFGPNFPGGELVGPYNRIFSGKKKYLCFPGPTPSYEPAGPRFPFN